MFGKKLIIVCYIFAIAKCIGRNHQILYIPFIISNGYIAHNIWQAYNKPYSKVLFQAFVPDSVLCSMMQPVYFQIMCSIYPLLIYLLHSSLFRKQHQMDPFYSHCQVVEGTECPSWCSYHDHLRHLIVLDYFKLVWLGDHETRISFIVNTKKKFDHNWKTHLYETSIHPNLPPVNGRGSTSYKTKVHKNKMQTKTRTKT